MNTSLTQLSQGTVFQNKAHFNTNTAIEIMLGGNSQPCNAMIVGIGDDTLCIKTCADIVRDHGDTIPAHTELFFQVEKDCFFWTTWVDVSNKDTYTIYGAPVLKLTPKAKKKKKK
jgi:hypothetical protein